MYDFFEIFQVITCNYWNEKLWKACKNGELDTVNEAISKQGVDLNWRSPSDRHVSELRFALV